jgi:hypothetical protein
MAPDGDWTGAEHIVRTARASSIERIVHNSNSTSIVGAVDHTTFEPALPGTKKTNFKKKKILQEVFNHGRKFVPV